MDGADRQVERLERHMDGKTGESQRTDGQTDKIVRTSEHNYNK